MSVIIHHGTPLTPKAALLDVCPGRAMCVSFAHPQDVEVVEQISPRIMFRQRRVFVLASGDQARRGMGRYREGLDALLSVAGTSIAAGAMGSHTRRAGSPQPAQRRATERLAIWANLRRPALAHGRPAVAPHVALRSLRPRSPWLDRTPKERARRLPALSRTHERSRSRIRQPMAENPHDARDSGCLRLPIYQRRFHVSSPKRTPL